MTIVFRVRTPLFGLYFELTVITNQHCNCVFHLRKVFNEHYHWHDYPKSLKNILKFETMQNKLCNILVPVDFTNKNKWAISKAIEMANQMNCNIHLVNIVKPKFFSSFTPYESRVDRLNSYDQLKDLAVSYSTQLFGSGKIEISLLEGNTTNKLAEYIRDFEMDMVVLGLSSNNLFQRRISSSSINKIAKKANVPVLAVGSNLIMINNPLEHTMPRWWNKLYNKILSYGSEIPVMTMSNQ